MSKPKIAQAIIRFFRIAIVAWGLLTLVSCGGSPENSADTDSTSPIETVGEVAAAATINCKAGTIRVCEADCPPNPCGKPICTCEPDPNYNPPVTGTVTPLFYITHVVYSPPGKSSNVTYTSSTSVGSSTSATSSFKRDEKITAGVSGQFLAGGSVSVTLGESWGSTQVDVTDVAYNIMNGYKKSGQADGINHDQDEIWFLASPLINVKIVKATATVPQSTQWAFSSDQSQAVPYFLYVGELRDPTTMPQPVRNTLAGFGISEAYYGQLLAADPYANGAPPDPDLNAARFNLVDTFPYVPPFAQGDTPGAQTHSETRTVTNSMTQTSELSYSVSLNINATAGFGPLVKASLTDQASWTWTHSSSTKESNGSGSSESVTVGQPSFGYNGPTILRVYVDKIWKTYFFSLDWDPACTQKCTVVSATSVVGNCCICNGVAKKYKRSPFSASTYLCTG